MWRELIQALQPQAAFSSPAAEEQVERAEERLGFRFPEQLRGLLSESDGVEGEKGLGVIWPVARIVSENSQVPQSYADSYMPFDGLLFFADAGNGDQFAFPVTGAKRAREEVFVWDHEDDSRRWFAASLRDYLDGWLNGRLTV